MIRVVSPKSRFAIWVAAIVMVWGILLPWVAETSPISRHLRWLDQEGIDGGAMFYTELKAMDPILERLAKNNRFGKR